MYMNQYQAARVSFVLKPDLSQQWLNNQVAPLNSKQQHPNYTPRWMPNERQRLSSTQMFSDDSYMSLSNSRLLNSTGKNINNSGGKCFKALKICLGLLLAASILASLGMNIYMLVYLTKKITDAPTGTIILFGGNPSNLPQSTGKWLLCDGSAVNRDTYADLFAVIGTTFGAGNGINSFNLPDFRGRFPLGNNGSSVLSTGGSSRHNLTVAELPAHNHDQGTLVTLTAGAHTHNINDPGHDHTGFTGAANTISVGSPGQQLYPVSGSIAYISQQHVIFPDFTGISIQTSGDHTHTVNGRTGIEGNGTAMNIMPPYQTINYIIRA